MKKHNITAAILAGGTSKRMGFNKELITLQNKRLIFEQINQFDALFDEVIIVSNHPEYYIDKDVLVIKDILESIGPLSGLHTALVHSKNDYVYLIACDMPNIDTKHITNTIKRIKNQEALVVKQNDLIEPFHGLYHKKIISRIEDFIIKNHKFTDFIPSLETEYISVENDDIFFNINTQNDIYHYEHNNDSYQDFTIQKHTSDKSKNIKDYVIDEYPLVLYINGDKYVTLLATPKHLEELVVGYLKSEKVISAYKDVESIEINIDLNEAYVKTYNEVDIDSLGKDKILVSGCGVGTKFHEALDKVIIDSIETAYTLSREDIYKASEELNNQSGLFKLTGGVHSCLFITDNSQIYYEDIGRHNAVDKVIGHIMINNLNTTYSFVFSSGRISSDMLLKCAISGIPIVISRSAPTSLAVTLAKKYGITLIGFARGTKFNIYSHPNRVK